MSIPLTGAGSSGVPEPLLANMLAWFRNNGTNYAPGGSNLAAVGSPGTAAGIGGTSGAAASGTFSAYYSGDPIVTGPGQSFTFAVWINWPTPTSFNFPFCELDGSSAPQNGFYGSGGTAYPSAYFDGSQLYEFDTLTPDTGFHHFALVIQADDQEGNYTWTAYLDGVQVGTDITIGSTFAATALQLARTADTCPVQFAAIWGRALTAAEVQRLYNSGLGYDPTQARLTAIGILDTTPNQFFGDRTLADLSSPVNDASEVGRWWTSTNGSDWVLASGSTAFSDTSVSITGLTPDTNYYLRTAIFNPTTYAMSAYRYIGGATAPGSTFATAWDPSELGSKLKTLLWLKNDDNGNFVFESADDSDPAEPGDPVSFVKSNFGASISASASTTARPTCRTDGLEFDTTNDVLSMSSAIAFGTADTEFFTWGNRVASANWIPFGATANDACAMIYNDGNAYFATNTTANYSQIAANPSGDILFWVRRVGSVVTVNWTGRGSSGTMSNFGSGPSGATTISAVGARPTLTQWNGSTSNRFRCVIATDGLTTDERNKLVEWLENNGAPGF